MDKEIQKLLDCCSSVELTQLKNKYADSEPDTAPSRVYESIKQELERREASFG